MQKGKRCSQYMERWAFDNDALLSILRTIFLSPQSHPALTVMLAISLLPAWHWAAAGLPVEKKPHLLQAPRWVRWLPAHALWLPWAPSTVKLSVLFLTTTFRFCVLISQRGKKKVDNNIYSWMLYRLHSYWHALSSHSWQLAWISLCFRVIPFLLEVSKRKPWQDPCVSLIKRE